MKFYWKQDKEQTNNTKFCRHKWHNVVEVKKVKSLCNYKNRSTISRNTIHTSIGNNNNNNNNNNDESNVNSEKNGDNEERRRALYEARAEDAALHKLMESLQRDKNTTIAQTAELTAALRTIIIDMDAMQRLQAVRLVEYDALAATATAL
ncbi:hypothetical protein LSM04_004839 [Trypanosoma melophagium]|uniref:uncharacterized protein n=1 Tax=Trypanosoma melophagium TaxID=715481 RepID=UPI00351A8DE5|nr:hypothetical protein LSM04_004839 [Trypanosoma melophagium]